MIEYIIVSGISLVLGPLMTYVIAKKLIKDQKDEILDTFEDYIASPEGQQSLYTLGLIFGKGVQQGIGLKGKVKGGKIFGLPADLVMMFAKKLMPGMVEEGEKKISEERPSKSGGGKFG